MFDITITSRQIPEVFEALDGRVDSLRIEETAVRCSVEASSDLRASAHVAQALEGLPYAITTRPA